MSEVALVGVSLCSLAFSLLMTMRRHSATRIFVDGGVKKLGLSFLTPPFETGTSEKFFAKGVTGLHRSAGIRVRTSYVGERRFPVLDKQVMQDEQIVGLFWERSERALSETQRKYNTYCCTLPRISCITGRMRWSVPTMPICVCGI